MNKPVFLWSIPRSASTAFERTFLERPDTEVFHEPYSVSFYYSVDRRNNRYNDVEPEEQFRYEAITSQIFGQRDKPVTFVKDMAYHLRDFWSQNFLSQVENTFLLRHPAAALSSQYRLLPDFNLEETGYPELEKVFMAVAELDGTPPLLIETEDFQREPEQVMSQYCGHIGIPFNKSSLAWEQKKVGIWGEWERWHLDALKSTGINPPKPLPDFETLPDHVKGMVERVMPIYDRLIKYKI